MAHTTAVYIDYDNVVISMNEYYSEDPINLLKEIRTSIVGPSKNLRVMKAFCDFKHTKNEEFSKLDSALVELRHVTSSGSNSKTNASDIALAIDVTKSLFGSVEIDEYIIVSSDSDMFSLIKELLFFNKKVTLIYLEANIRDSYLSSMEHNGVEFKSIEDILGIEVYKEPEAFNIENEESVKEMLLKINENINYAANSYPGDTPGKKAGTGFNKLVKAVAEFKKIAEIDSKSIVNELINEGYLKKYANGRFTNYRISKEKCSVLLDGEIILLEEDFI